MTTHALDIASLLHAMHQLAGEIGDNAGWKPVDADTEYVVEMLQLFGQDFSGSRSIKALASTDWEALNRFLVSHRFRPAVEPFDPSQGLGVVSILDKLLKWKSGPAKKTTISTPAGQKPGFVLPKTDVTIYKAAGFLGHLLRIEADGADTLWIYLPSTDEAYMSVLDGLHLVELTFAVMGADRYVARGLSGAVVPMLEFSLEPDISFMLGAQLESDDQILVVTQAGQQFKLRLDETGARIKTETHLVAMRGSLDSSRGPLIVNRPFIGWFTEAGTNDRPMAAFFADFDSWKQPEGSLQDL